MPDIKSLRPQTPIEGPPLPAGTEVKWYDDPEKVKRAVTNYVDQMRGVRATEHYETSMYRTEFGGTLGSGKLNQMVNNFMNSQRRAIENYVYWLTNKVHNK